MVDKRNCCGCHACVSACPQNCISMNSDNLGFLYPNVETEKCINCGICNKVCPAQVQLKEKEYTPFAFGGYAKSSQIRKSSSSGGAFHILAEYVLRNKGLVVGAALSEDFRSVHHIIIDDIKYLYLLHGSKYTQSTIGSVFCSTKEALDNNKLVLFSGTPCQIDGLNLYLRKEYKNLITIEIICHGTPSPKVYHKYIDEMEKNLNDQISGVFFRDETGGSILIMRIETKNGKVYRKDITEDLFYQMFLSDSCLRESCYDCPSRGLKKRADITLSDFWGAENVAPDLVDGKGLSLICVHSEKGERLFNKVKSSFEGHEVSFGMAIKGNPSFFISHDKPKTRDKIQNDIDKYNMKQLVNKYACTKKYRIKKILINLHLYGIVKRIIK